jgi:microcompartment protein CcmK/EutM
MDEGNSARQMLNAKEGAVKTVVVAVVDYVERDGALCYDHREAT